MAIKAEGELLEKWSDMILYICYIFECPLQVKENLPEQRREARDCGVGDVDGLVPLVRQFTEQHREKHRTGLAHVHAGGGSRTADKINK